MITLALVLAMNLQTAAVSASSDRRIKHTPSAGASVTIPGMIDDPMVSLASVSSTQPIRLREQPKLPEVRLEMSPEVMESAWNNAMDVLRGLGENPEELLREAALRVPAVFGAQGDLELEFEADEV